LHTTGLWPTDNEDKGVGAILRKSFASILLTIALYSSFFGNLIYCYQNMGVNLQPFLESMAANIVNLVALATFFSLLFRQKQFALMFHAVEAMRQSGSHLPERPTGILERNSQWSRGPLYYMLGCSFAVIVSLFPLVDVYNERRFVYE
jgi:hypothetical protein